jgi:hypothetical protein
MIRADVRIDGSDLRVIFDATAWFEAATDTQIERLADCGWDGDYPADEVAVSMRSANRQVDALFVPC